MISRGTRNGKAGNRWIGILLFAVAMLLVNAAQARAEFCVADLGGVIDGFVTPNPPSQIKIDGNCTIRNFPASNPLDTNFSFLTQPGQTDERWLVVFDNVVHTGQMSCNSVAGHHIWFTNGSSTGIHQSCQNLLIPVEKINKQNPAGQTTATIGVPFTYRLTIPVLFDPATGGIINNSGSVNTLHGITVTDDLNATGVNLSYVSHTITWVDDGTPVPHTFSNVGGVLTFNNFPIVTAGRQFVIALTVVLNDVPVNVPGTQFINTAKWEFGRLIDGTFYAPLPGEWGVTPPMTIGAPVVTVTKSGPATMNLGQWGNFAINAQNTGLGEAWNVSLRDLLPDGATGGMCDQTPEMLGAQVFAADGVTPVPGKGPLNPGSDYSLSYSGAPNCRLDITMLTAAGRIGPNERLIVRYRTQLDNGTQNGIPLTNIAGAIQWFNGDSSNPNRVTYNRTLTNGTVGIPDHEDAHTVTVNLAGYFFEKTVIDITSGANPATTVAPGDRLHYTLRFQSPGQALSNFSIVDELDALNAVPAFAPGTLTLVSYPAGADISATSSTGGANGTGILDIRNLSLPVNGQLIIQFEITLKQGLANGSVVSNQSTARSAGGTVVAVSDDPGVNGTADPIVSGDEDPTRVTIGAAPAFRIQKISTDMTGDPNALLAGDTLRYTITVKNIGNEDAVNVMLRDAVPANTTYVAGSTTLNGAAVSDLAGLSPLVSGMLIHSPANPTPGSMPADPSASPANVATITFNVVVVATVPNGTVVSNQAFVSAPDRGIVDQPSDDPDTPIANDPTRDVVGNLPLLYAEKRAALFVDLGTPGVVDPGDTLRYTITVQNSAAIAATGVILRDIVPANTTYVANSTLLNGSPVGQPDGGIPPLAAAGVNAGTISGGTTSTVQFDLLVNNGTPNGTLISNQAQVYSVELPKLLTDGDGNPSTGPEPTVVVVGASPQLLITKQVTVVGGGAALPGAALEYVVRVTNIGAVPAPSVVITDDLGASAPGQLAYVGGSATMNGSTAGVTFSGSTITANYAAVSGPLGPGAVVLLRFRAVLNSGLTNGTVVTNTGVVAWNNPVQTASASASVVVGSFPGTLPSLYSEKRVALFVDLGSPGIVDPGDTLRYTITTQNSGTNAATSVVLRDSVPANTTYVTNSTLLNGSPVGQPDGGVSPLASGINAGTIAPGVTSTLQFDLRVNSGTPAGTLISNQAVVDSVELPDLLTDGDGNRGTGPEPTVIVVGVGQQLSITKQVTVVGGGAALPGATLDYVVNATNIGPVPATNVIITDDLGASAPGQLTYVSGSATMNGSTSGVTFSGSTITANYAGLSGPLGPGAGVVLRFRAVLDPGLATNTVVTNTGVAAWNNPAQTAHASVSVVVGTIPGTLPTLYAEKHVALFVDLGSPGIVDPGDTLRYTITTENSGTNVATGVILRDNVPANTTYVTNSTLLNGSPFGQPDGGVSPLASGINAGTIAPGVTSTLQFDLRVNNGTPAGTLISNQAVVDSVELPDLRTDGDGNRATGPEPTVIVVGVGQQLSITKQVTVVGGGAALPGATLEYVVNATNIGPIAATNVIITDDLNSAPGQLAFVSGSATMNGSTSGVTFAGSTITANYAALSGPLAPGAGVVLRFRAVLAPSLATGTVVTNTGVAAWNNPAQTTNASVAIIVGSFPGLSVLNGSAWYDTNFNNARDPGERPLDGWSVELYRNSQLWNSAVTDANGVYRFILVEPNDVTGIPYEVRFRAPGAGATTATLGRTGSPFTNGMQRITDIIVPGGASLQGLNLPIQPNGVIYNSMSRAPIAGARLTMLDARNASPLPASCFDDAAQQGQITLAGGYYKFDVNFSDPACPSGGDYRIDVLAPAGTNFVAGYSQIIPPTSGPSTAAFSVPACPASTNDTIPGTPLFCEVQTSEFAPAASVAPRSAGTIYHVHLMLDGSQVPGTSQIFNNHIPVDPELSGSIAISKTTPLLNVTRGQLVPYTITANNVAGLMLTDVSIVDRLPAGFTYIQGSALLDGVPAEPSVAAQELRWNGLGMAGTQVRTVKLLLGVGAGVTEGEFVNRARVVNGTSGVAMSGEATATVRVMPDPTFDCTDVTGKVFNDANRNGRQDDGENGLPGVRVVTARGLQATTDQYGRYHITCAATPNESRGSNFVLKLDDRTLPGGFRLSTDQVQIKRITRGKDVKFNFGASIHRVVGIDLSDAAFEPGKTEIRIQWRPRIDLLLEELRKAPAVLRLSYIADIEDAGLVERRVEAVKRQLTDAWKATNDSYVLTIEPEVFWRRGAPPKRPDVRVQKSR